MEQACLLYQQVLQSDPGNVEIWMAVGNLRAKAGAFEAAAEAFAHVVALRPDQAAGWINHGNALRRIGQRDEAVSALRRGIALEPGLAQGHYNLGVALSETDALEQAEAAFSRTIALDPSHLAARMNLGNLMLKRGDHARALRSFAEVRQRDTGFPRIDYNLGVALQAAGRDREAVAAFRHALERDPQHLEARNNLVVALIRAGQSGEALAECDRYLSQSPANPKAMAYKAAALIELERRQEAAFLLDFDRLLFKHRIDVPVGYASIEALNGALALQIEAHPSLRFEPDEKSTRGGSQTGEFAHAATGAAAALRGAIVAAVRGYIDRLRTTMPAHPFVVRLPDRWRLATWAVVLQSQGYQEPHVHPDGCISGVYSVSMPAGMRAARGDQGAIEFGRTSAAIGGTQEPLIATVAPREGTLLLFPSYFYHLTIPFEAEGNRVSVAFDVLPD